MTPKQIAKKLKKLSETMIELGTAMDYYGGFDGQMVQHGRELVGAGLIAKSWAEDIEAEILEQLV